jgi:hypothetical protein
MCPGSACPVLGVLWLCVPLADWTHSHSLYSFWQVLVNAFAGKLQITAYGSSDCIEEWCLLGCYAVWLL